MCWLVLKLYESAKRVPMLSEFNWDDSFQAVKNTGEQTQEHLLRGALYISEKTLNVAEILYREDIQCWSNIV